MDIVKNMAQKGRRKANGDLALSANVNCREQEGEECWYGKAWFDKWVRHGLINGHGLI